MKIAIHRHHQTRKISKILLRNRGGPGQPIARIKGYVENVVSKYNSEVFKTHFRMYPETFEFVLGLIGPKIAWTKSAGGKKPIEAKKQLLIALWMMATPDSYRSVCEKSDVGKATALRSVHRVKDLSAMIVT